MKQSMCLSIEINSEEAIKFSQRIILNRTSTRFSQAIETNFYFTHCESFYNWRAIIDKECKQINNKLLVNMKSLAV